MEVESISGLLLLLFLPCLCQHLLATAVKPIRNETESCKFKRGAKFVTLNQEELRKHSAGKLLFLMLDIEMVLPERAHKESNLLQTALLTANF